MFGYFSILHRDKSLLPSCKWWAKTIENFLLDFLEMVDQYVFWMFDDLLITINLNVPFKNSEGINAYYLHQNVNETYGKVVKALIFTYT